MDSLSYFKSYLTAILFMLHFPPCILFRIQSPTAQHVEAGKKIQKFSPKGVKVKARIIQKNEVDSVIQFLQN